jgi:molybdopterin/thiamine biosynthesis adenylyltransferase
LLDRLDSLSETKSFPDNATYRGLAVASVLRLAKEFSVAGKDIEIAALEQGIVPERYVRNMKTFTIEEQAILLKSSVSVVGLGGLGGGVTEILARIGVGKLTLIDGDSFEDSNLNRQFLSRQGILATPKAEAAARRVKEINSSIIVCQHNAFFSEETGEVLIGSPDVVVDCLDSLQTRMVLERISKRIGVPLVSAAVAGSSGHITTIFPEDHGLQLIYGEKIDPTLKGAEASLGCLPHAVTLLASLECSEVIKILLKSGTVSRNKLLVVDLLDNTFDTLQLI